MLGSVHEFNSSLRYRRFKGLVKGAFGVRVEIVQHQRDPFAFSVSGIQKAGQLQCPVLLSALAPRGRPSIPSQRFGKHEDTRRSVALGWAVGYLG